jgi:hypothetical protein
MGTMVVIRVWIGTGAGVGTMGTDRIVIVAGTMMQNLQEYFHQK